jgi:hypothetical protein
MPKNPQKPKSKAKRKSICEGLDLKRTNKKQLIFTIRFLEDVLQNQGATIKHLRETIAFQQKLINDTKEGTTALGEKFYEIRQELEKQLEDCQKEKTDAVRAYQGLAKMGKFAEDMGIDLEKACEELPESEKNKYDFSQKHTVLESGRIKHEYNLKPKVKPKEGKGRYYFGKWYPDKKPKKPNGKGPK